MDTARFSQGMRDVIGYSREEAQRLGSEIIAPEHLLLGILRERDSKAILHMSKLNIDLQLVKGTLKAEVFTGECPIRMPICRWKSRQSAS